jgi:hypothetical protein
MSTIQELGAFLTKETTAATAAPPSPAAEQPGLSRAS